MKRCHLAFVLILVGFTVASRVSGQTNDPAAMVRSDAEQAKRAAAWVESLGLDDPAKAARVRALIITHLKAVRDWHNGHPYTTVPEGVNPITGRPLSTLDRQFIADSAIPKSVHEDLMAGL